MTDCVLGGILEIFLKLLNPVYLLKCAFPFPRIYLQENWPNSKKYKDISYYLGMGKLAWTNKTERHNSDKAVTIMNNGIKIYLLKGN